MLNICTSKASTPAPPNAEFAINSTTFPQPIKTISQLRISTSDAQGNIKGDRYPNHHSLPAVHSGQQNVVALSFCLIYSPGNLMNWKGSTENSHFISPLLDLTGWRHSSAQPQEPAWLGTAADWRLFTRSCHGPRATTDTIGGEGGGGTTRGRDRDRGDGYKVGRRTRHAWTTRAISQSRRQRCRIEAPARRLTDRSTPPRPAASLW